MAKEILNSMNEEDYKKRVEELDEKERRLNFMLDAFKKNGNIPEVVQTELERDLSLDEKYNDSATKVVIHSKTYKGRNVMVLQSGHKSLSIVQYSDHQLKRLGDKYQPTNLNLSEETFILLLETFLFSAKFLKIDKSEIIKKLTEGRDSDEIEFMVREYKNIS